MIIRRLQYIISVTCTVLIIVHILFPALSFDAVTLGLIILAVIPWLAPIFKSIEMPGGWKVEFQELLRTEKKADAVGLLASVKSETSKDEYTYQLIQKSEPNLALAGLRLEIETRLRRIAEANNILDENQTASLLVKKLVNEKIFEKNEGQVIQELLRLLNAAVHGAHVDQLSVEWATEIGPRILHALDKRWLG
jgi:hypothetical protein